VGAFRPLDGTLPSGIIKLPVGRDIYRDPAFQVSIEIAQAKNITRKQAADFARKLLTRRAFYQLAENSWSHGLYTFLVTYHIWEDLVKKFVGLGLERDIHAVEQVRALLDELISISSNVLGIKGHELDQLRSRPLINHAQIMEHLPQTPAPNANVREAQKERRTVIKKINQTMLPLGPDLKLGTDARPPSTK
jgi:Icc protein